MACVIQTGRRVPDTFLDNLAFVKRTRVMLGEGRLHAYWHFHTGTSSRLVLVHHIEVQDCSQSPSGPPAGSVWNCLLFHWNMLRHFAAGSSVRHVCSPPPKLKTASFCLRDAISHNKVNNDQGKRSPWCGALSCMDQQSNREGFKKVMLPKQPQRQTEEPEKILLHSKFPRTGNAAHSREADVMHRELIG